MERVVYEPGIVGEARVVVLQLQKLGDLWSEGQGHYSEYDYFVLFRLKASAHFSVDVLAVVLSGAVGNDVVFYLFLEVSINLRFHLFKLQSIKQQPLRHDINGI